MNNISYLLLFATIIVIWIIYQKIKIENNKVEPLVISDSEHSICKEGCIIACSSLKPPYRFLGADCLKRCIEICPNYSPGVRGTDI